jgi:hypothetical protein
MGNIIRRHMSNKFYRAKYESSNFEFEGYGLTRAEALKTLKDGLRKHTEQHELEKGWYSKDDINIYLYRFGVPYRDCDTIDAEEYEDPNDYVGMGWVGQDGRP